VFAAVLTCAQAAASVATPADCIEDGEFVANAAHARVNGMERADFIGRMQDDFRLIQAFPPELRWFARDADDEAFLLATAASVFDAPDAPERHRRELPGRVLRSRPHPRGAAGRRRGIRGSYFFFFFFFDRFPSFLGSSIVPRQSDAPQRQA
jgi:hypothetical protein